MPRLQSRSFDEPDEIRTFAKGSGAVVTIDDVTVGLGRWQPGWRWSEHLGPIVGTPTCELHHVGYALSGTMRFECDDGRRLEVTGGSVYEVPAGHDAAVIGDEDFVTLEWVSSRVIGLGSEGAGTRIVATVLFTDIVDSTATLARVGDETWRGLLGEHNRRLREQLDTYRGREIDTTGDGFLVIFDSASRAVRCGRAMVAAAHEAGVAIRVGIHTGEVDLIGEHARGVAVHMAARVMSIAGADEVVVSATTHDLAEGTDLAFEDAGSHLLKGLAGERHLYRLVDEGEA